MATVDDKVVAMSFESSKFESGVNNVISALDKLKKALQFPTAGKGLEDINAAGQKVDLSHIGKAIEGIKDKFGALSVAALAVFANIATKAVSAGGRLLKSLTLDPIISGFKEYETGLNAVQTILSNTAAAGTKLKDVNKALDQLNTYADKTIYNFSEMTKNIGTFTAAGVDLKTATSSIKGIANLAALSGSNSQQASTAMYQLSQAISAGKVSLQDWNSVVNAGMGGTVFQRALAQTAQHMGTLSDGAVELKGKMKNVSIEGQSFRESIQAKPGEKSWLTSDVLTTTLKQLSGDLTDAQLKAQGYSDAQIKAIQTQAKMALNAATQVKTLSQLLDTTKEAVGSGWAKTWQIIFGDFGEAKTLFTGLSNAIGGFVSASADARNKVLGDWKDLGGRTLLIESIKNVFQALGAVIKPIKEAFRDIFPATTGKQLYELTQRFHDFTETLTPGPATVENLKRTFRGLFALLDIGKQIIGGIFTVFGKMFGVIAEGGGSFLNVTGSIGDFLVSVDQALRKGDRLKSFFETLGTVLAAPIRLFGALASAIANLFSQKASGGVSDAIGGMGQALTPLQKIIYGVESAWAKFLDSLGNTNTVLGKAMQGLSEFFGGLGEFIGNTLKNLNWDQVLETVKVGLLGGLVLMVKKFFGGGSFAEQFGGGILSSISGTFEALQGSMVALQQNIKAKTLKEIAIAVALLAASMVALSLINPQKLQSALTGMTIAMGELMGAMAIITNVSKSAGFIKLPFVAGGLILLATAVLILTGAVRSLAGLDWEELAKGLGGVGVLLVAISAASGPLSKNSAGMISAGAGIAAIAVAMKILASAIGDFGGLSWAQIGKGLASVALSMGLLGAATRLMPTGMVGIGAGLIAVAMGLKLLASAVNQFGTMDWSTIGKGLLSIGAAMLIIAGAMTVMPSNMLVSAAGLLIVAVALNIMGKAVQSFGNMSIEQIAKGLGTLAGALAILAAALYAMSGTLAGAAALVVAAGAVAILAPALKTLGEQSWGSIIKGLVALGAAFVVLGVAGALLTPVIPNLIGLGAALLLIGGGLALAGVGIALIGTGLSAIAVAGPTAVRILVDALVSLVEAIPRVVVGLVTGLLTIVNQLAATAPKFVAALIKIIDALLEAIIQSAPKMAEAFSVLIKVALKVIGDNFPGLVNAGFQMLMSLLRGINDHISDVVQMVVTIVITILNTLTGQIPRIIQAGANILAKLLLGIANAYGTVVSTAVSVVGHFLEGIANNFGKIVSQGVSIVSHVVSGIANSLGKVISAGATIISNVMEGISDNVGKLVNRGVDIAVQLIHGVASAAVRLATAGGDAVLDILHGVTKYVNENSAKFGAAGGDLAVAIISGMARGIAAGAGRIISALGGVVGSAISAAKKKLHIKSPSRVFWEIGENMMKGLAIGIDETGGKVEKSMVDVADTMVATLAAVPPALEGIMDLDPVIKPVLDLSQVQQGAQALPSMLAVPVTASASYGQASTISAEQAAQTTGEEIPTPGVTSVTFEQNNYSPEALSAIEIYRQTKNQLSQAKAVLVPA